MRTEKCKDAQALGLEEKHGLTYLDLLWEASGKVLYSEELHTITYIFISHFPALLAYEWNLDVCQPEDVSIWQADVTDGSDLPLP